MVSIIIVDRMVYIIMIAPDPSGKSIEKLTDEIKQCMKDITDRLNQHTHNKYECILWFIKFDFLDKEE